MNQLALSLRNKTSKKFVYIDYVDIIDLGYYQTIETELPFLLLPDTTIDSLKKEYDDSDRQIQNEIDWDSLELIQIKLDYEN